MSASLSEWVERLGISSLPAIPFTLQRIPLLLDRQSTTNADFERVIGRDPGFALALFRDLGANATQLEEPISSLAHAVSMLGVDAVTRTRRTLKVLEPPSKNMTLAHSMSATQEPPTLLFMHLIWRMATVMRGQSRSPLQPYFTVVVKWRCGAMPRRRC